MDSEAATKERGVCDWKRQCPLCVSRDAPPFPVSDEVSQLLLVEARGVKPEAGPLSI